MGAVVVIGDEITTTGFRLAGASTIVPDPGDVAACFARATTEADLVMITAGLASELDPDDLDAAVRRAAPLVLVIPGIATAETMPDVGAAADRALGIAS